MIKILVFGWTFQKLEVVEKIDKIFKIPKSRKIVKLHYAETKGEDIDKFSHYVVGFKSIDRGFDCNFNKSSCSIDCSVGANISSPFTLKEKKLQKLDIGEIFVALIEDRYLLVSHIMRSLFEENSITGLEYEECKLDKNMDIGQHYYFSKVTGEGSSKADDIIIRRWSCQKHNVPADFHLFNRTYPNKLISNNDFQLIKTLNIGSKTYKYQRSILLVSTRALQLILKSKRRNLMNLSFFHGIPYEPFAPEGMIRDTIWFYDMQHTRLLMLELQRRDYEII